jgi:hypothetical protein
LVAHIEKSKRTVDAELEVDDPPDTGATGIENPKEDFQPGR